MRYRPLYPFLGIALVVIAILGAVAIDPNGRTPLYVGAVAPIVLLVGILAYQWTWASSQAPPKLAGGVAETAQRDAGSIDDYWEMYELMAVSPIDRDAVRRSQQGMMDVIKANIGLAAAVTVLPIGAAVMVISGEVPDLGSGAFLVAVPFALAPLALLWVRYQMGRAGSSGAAMLEPLGLELTQMPTVGVESRAGSGSGFGSRISGASVMEGERRGRRVRIALGDVHRTEIRADVARFTVERDGNRLRAGPDSPPAVRELVEALGPSPHWKKLRHAKGGSDGIVAERKVDTDSGWLWDLWLCERLANRLD